MPDPYILLSAAVLAVTFLVHVVVGGKHVARPLLADARLPRAAKWLSYYCWHLVSLMLLALAAGVAVASLSRPPPTLVLGVAVFLLSCSGLSAWVAAKGRIHPLRFPSTSLFLIASVLLFIAFGLGFGGEPL